MPITKEALQIFVAMVPGMISFLSIDYVTPLKTRPTSDKLCFIVVFCAIDYFIYSCFELFNRTILPNYAISSLKNLFLFEQLSSVQYIVSVAVLFLISFFFGAFFGQLLNQPKTIGFLDKYVKGRSRS